MRRYVTALATAGLFGFMLGLVFALRDWSTAWPRLSLFALLRSGAVGWLVGVVCSPLLGRLWPGGARGHLWNPSGRRVVTALLAALALAPAVLWLAPVLPRGWLREAAPLARRPGDARPNLILITIDALRTDHLGAYGSRRGLTPNLDAFAREATQYDAAYVGSPWTLTSFGTVFTSLSPSQCGLKSPEPVGSDWYRGRARLPEEINLLPEQLQRAGYTTTAELTNVFLEADRGWSRGFDHFRNEGGADGTNSELAHAQTLTEHTLDWVKLNRRQPFFLWVHYLDPHCPYDAPDTPPRLRARYPSHWVARRERWYQGIRQAPAGTRRRYQEFCRVMYAEEVRYVDRWAGELLKGLRGAGVYENSLVVMAADHGEELFDHGGFDHGHSMHEEVLSVPLLVKWPRGVAADKRVTQTVASAELAGTLLEFAHAPDLNGHKVQALPRRDGARGCEVYSEALLYGLEQTALTTDGYRVVYHPYGGPRGGRFEVFDRRADRQERHDLAATGAASELRSRLKALAQSAQAEARRWQASRGEEARPFQLSEQAKERLRALGYVGD